MVKDPDKVNFSYRDNLWQGCDMLATGVASFGHISGVHYQNAAEWNGYIDPLLEEGSLPLARGLRLTPRESLIRQLILLLKRGYLDAEFFHQQHGVDILDEWQDVWRQYADEGMLAVEGRRVLLTRKGLLHADGLLPAFFEPHHRGVRYT
jgi:oxygen-independent coproporphyrinogen-3 oxidase